MDRKNGCTGGFAVNIVDQWFRNNLKSKMSEHLLDTSSMMFKYLRSDKVKELLNQHAKGTNDNHKILFSLVAVEQWLRCN